MADKRTPGPWKQSPDHPWIVKQDNAPISDEGVMICSVLSHEASAVYPNPEQGRANARLIATAPELLEALEQLLIDMTIAQSNMRAAALRDALWEGCADAIQPRVNAARAALAKARGEA